MKARVIGSIVLALAFVCGSTSTASADDDSFLELTAKLTVAGSAPAGTNPKAKAHVEVTQRTSTSSAKARFEAQRLQNFNGVAVNIRRNGTVIATVTVVKGKLKAKGTFGAGFFTAGDVITVTTTAGVIILTGTLVDNGDD